MVEVAQQMLGKVLCTELDGVFTSGKIVETEAYKAPEDMGSHAYNNKLTPRKSPFFEPGDIAYAYLIYGTYNLFNVITSKKLPHAVLIRGIVPMAGIESMLECRRMESIKCNLTAGPGLLSMALGINLTHNKTDLQGNTIWIEDDGTGYSKIEIIASTRVGMNISEPWNSIPWLFREKAVSGVVWRSDLILHLTPIRQVSSIA